MCFKKPTKQFYESVSQFDFIRVDINYNLSGNNMNKIFLTNMYERAYEFYKGLLKFMADRSIIVMNKKDVRIVIEEPTLGRSGGTNLNMAFGIGALSSLLRYKSGYFVYFVSPSKLKKVFSNYGLASKKDMSKIFISIQFENINPSNFELFREHIRDYVYSDTLSLPKPLDDIVDSFALVIYDLMNHQK